MLLKVTRARLLTKYSIRTQLLFNSHKSVNDDKSIFIHPNCNAVCMELGVNAITISFKTINMWKVIRILKKTHFFSVVHKWKRISR